MRYRINGGVTGSVLTTTTSTASGIFAMPEVSIKKGDSTWPILVQDSYFNYNNILLKGDGTNTANNDTIIDSSTNGFTLTRSGKTAQGPYSPHSINGWSVYFNSTDYIQTTSSSTAFSFGTGNFTVEMWVNTTQFGNRGLFQTSTTAGGFAAASPPTGTGGIQLYLTSSNTFGVMVNGAWNNPTASAVNTMTAGVWYHVALVRNSGVVKLYINGVADPNLGGTGVSTINDTSNYTATYAVVGGYFNGSYLCNSYISNLRVVKGTAVYTGTFTPPTSNLTAISGTSFLTAQSNRMVDNSTNQLALTITGAKLHNSSPYVPVAPYVSSSIGGSLYFNGSTDYLSKSYSTTSFDWWTSDYTLECWVFPLTLTGWGYLDGTVPKTNLIGNNAYNSTANYWSFGPYSNGTVGLTYFNGSSVGVFSTETVKINQWNHIAFTKTSSGITIFVNGVASSTTAVSGTPQSGTSQSLVIGAGNNSYINGYISNLRILKGTALYSGNFTPPTESLSAITNTQLLLSGTNSGIYDSTTKQNLVTNGTYISTSQSKFGVSSIYFSGGTSSLYAVPISTSATPLVNHAGNLGAGNYTVEMWVYWTSNSNAFQCLATSRYGTASYVGTWWLGVYTTSSKLCVFDAATNLGQTTMNLPLNQWSHVALVRYNNVIKIYIDGVLGLTSASNTTDYTCSELSFGYDRGEAAYPWVGYMDDIRITRGVARYTAAFTPTTTTFPIQ